MVDRLRVTELDFDTIKENLKDFLSQQSEFTDYNFEGSGLSVLLDILAYSRSFSTFFQLTFSIELQESLLLISQRVRSIRCLRSVLSSRQSYCQATFILGRIRESV